jgi:hypothetical protein
MERQAEVPPWCLPSASIRVSRHMLRRRRAAEDTRSVERMEASRWLFGYRPPHCRDKLAKLADMAEIVPNATDSEFAAKRTLRQRRHRRYCLQLAYDDAAPSSDCSVTAPARRAARTTADGRVCEFADRPPMTAPAALLSSTAVGRRTGTGLFC